MAAKILAGKTEKYETYEVRTFSMPRLFSYFALIFPYSSHAVDCGF